MTKFNLPDDLSNPNKGKGYIQVPSELFFKQAEQAAEIQKLWEDKITPKMKELGLENTLVLRVHDSWIFEVPAEELSIFLKFEEWLYDQIYPSQ